MQNHLYCDSLTKSKRTCRKMDGAGTWPGHDEHSISFSKLDLCRIGLGEIQLAIQEAWLAFD